MGIIGEPCADRCTILADVIHRLSVAEGRSEREARVSVGLSPEFVPPLPARTVWRHEAEFTD